MSAMLFVMSVDYDERLEEIISNPASAASDGRQATELDPLKVIAVQNHQATKTAISNNDGDAWGGCCRSRAKPGGACQ